MIFIAICLCWIASVSAFPLILRQSGSYSRLIVFGDSFSDDGDGAWLASNKTWPSDPAYYDHHFSNGPVWPQYVAQDFNLELHDYAAGGATADNSFVAGFTGRNSTIPVPSVLDQINTFFRNDTVRTGDIYVIYIGANDILFNDTITGQQIGDIIEGQVHRLYDQGARTVLLADYPRLNSLPATYNISDAAIVGAFGDQLRTSLLAVVAGWSPYMHISLVDVFLLAQNITTSPANYGLNSTYLNPPTGCLQGVYASEMVPRSLCSDPDAHFFFDAFHPTTKIHRYIANLFGTTIRSFS